MLEGMSATAPEAELDILDAPEAGATAVRSSAFRSGGFAAGVLLSLISVPLLIRHLGRDDYGVYVAITAIITIIAGASDVGITSVGVREWAVRGIHERHTLLANLLGVRLTLITLGCVGAMGFGVAAGYDLTRIEGLAAACVGLVVIATYEALAVPLQAELRQSWIALAELVRQAIQVTLIVVFVLVGAGLVPLLASAIPGALAAVALTLRASRQGLVRPALHPRAWWDLMHDTLPFAMASAVSVVYLRTTVILMSLIASGQQTGYFAPAFRAMEVLISIPVLLVGALLPVLARAAATDRERMRMAISRTLEGAIACGSLMAVCAVAGAPLAIQVLVGEQPAPTVDALAILSVGLAFSFVGASNQFALLALRQHRPILIVNVVALLVNTGLTLTLVPAWGARGAALALSASEVTVAALSTALLAQSMKGFSPSRSVLLRIALATTLGAVAALALHGLGSVPELFGTVLVCSAAALALRTLPRELWALTPSWLRPPGMRAAAAAPVPVPVVPAPVPAPPARSGSSEQDGR
jgi:O-antigen/teichoic acid export membrane protein